MSKRFILNKNEINVNGEYVEVKGNGVHHLNVLRHKAGDIVRINEYDVEILTIDNNKLEGRIVDKYRKSGEPDIQITLYQSYLKSDKMEYVVEKAVELGVKRIVPILSKNTVVKLNEKDKVKKVEKLRNTAIAACEQCGRTDMVDVIGVYDISKLEQSLIKHDVIIIAHEKSDYDIHEAVLSIKEKGKFNNIGIIIGPEGGLDDREIEYIQNLQNTYTVSLGERILRAETASLNLISIIGYEF